MQTNPQQVQSFVYKALEFFIQSKVYRLIKSGVTDESKLLEETLKKAKENQAFQKQMNQFGIGMDVVEETAKKIIKDELTKTVTKSQRKKVFGIF
jgi:hypothetical protein